MGYLNSAKQKLRPRYRALKQKKQADDYCSRYQKYAFDENGTLTAPEQFESCITRLYHTIEKGLAFPEFRAGFGMNNIQKLLHHMELYAKKFDTTAFFYRTALSVLQAYIHKNVEYGYEDPELESRVEKLPGEPNDLGGVIPVRPLSLEKVQSLGYADFVKSRHSVRHFSEAPVDIERTKAAVALAQHTPSACNRQGWKARIVVDPELLSELIKNQNGNRGFGEEINQMIVVTGDLRYFNQDREQFQVFIDGGMYAQSIIQALHYEGIAMIPLSASLWNEQEQAVRRLLKIEEAEVLIMFIGVGNYVDECVTTRSERKPAQIIVID